jgi:hypothetical protein
VEDRAAPPSSEAVNVAPGMHDATNAGSRNIGSTVRVGAGIVTCFLIEITPQR